MTDILNARTPVPAPAPDILSATGRPAKAWTVKSRDGALSIYHLGASKRCVEEKVVGTLYDPEALCNDHVYRALFDEELADALLLSGYTVVRVYLAEVL